MSIQEKIKKMALEKYGVVGVNNWADPLEMLINVSWKIPQEATPSETMAMWNIHLDERSCLGRLARAATLVEKFFPKSTILAAEVLQDFLRNKMIEIVKNEENPPIDMIEEVLLYEEPHSVIEVDGKQFDPLSQVYPFEIVHPQVQTFSVWEYVTCAHLVSRANLTRDLEEKISFLNEAESVCPGSILVMENRISSLVTAGRIIEAVNLLMKIIEKRPTARTLFVLDALTGDVQYHKRLLNEYTPNVFEILLREVEHEQQRQRRG